MKSILKHFYLYKIFNCLYYIYTIIINIILIIILKINVKTAIKLN